MSKIFNVEHFKQYNGFYGSAQYRPVVRHLYKGRCSSCRTPVSGDCYHVAHIISRSHPSLMEKYFPGLDVDNLLNLRLACPDCNHDESNFVIDAPVLMHAFNVSAKVIAWRLHAVLESLGSSKPAIQMSAIDSRICTDVLHVSPDEIKDISADWCGAVVISREKLEDRVRQAMKRSFCDGADLSTYTTLEEAIGYFRDSIQIDGGTVISSGKRQPAWWVKANSYFFGDKGPREQLSEEELAMKPADGIYLDPHEVEERRGLWIPLRTASQRWFRDVFAIINCMQRKADVQSKHRYVVIDEDEYHDLMDCFGKLTIVASGINCGGKRLKKPEVFANFSTYDGVLQIYPEGLEIPESVKQLCQAEGDTSILGSGAVLSKSQLRSWLTKAFHLARMGAEAVGAPDLVRIEDPQFGCSWVPPLPNIKGKTWEQIQTENSPKKTSRIRSRPASPAS